MAMYSTNGKQLLNVEYDVVIEVNDLVDGMRVMSTDRRSPEEYAVFLLDNDSKISCYVFDEIYIVGKVSGFNNLVEAVNAWNDNEI